MEFLERVIDLVHLPRLIVLGEAPGETGLLLRHLLREVLDGTMRVPQLEEALGIAVLDQVP